MPVKVPFEEKERHKWRLEVDRGRQVWNYVEHEASNIGRLLEQHLLTKRSNNPDADYENVAPMFNTPEEACHKAGEFYGTIQTEDGHWAGDYGGPMFLLPGMLIACYITGVELPSSHQREMIRYLTNTQSEDGGWGLHIESRSTMFGTVLNYVGMRILGVDKDDSRMITARHFIHENGGALGIPSWGKFWLATLNCFGWEAVDPVLPELWYLPYWMPIHPGRLWCHCRVVYLPMSFIYGMRGTAKLTPLIRSLREELFVEDFDSIQWRNYRLHAAKTDHYNRPSPILPFAWAVLAAYDRNHIPAIRKRALDMCLDHIKYEDRHTHFICIGPVNKVINMLAVWYAEGETEHFKNHVDRLYDYLWLSDDGMKMQGYNGSQLWDTAFAVQAYLDSNLHFTMPNIVKQAHHYIDITQVRNNTPELKKYFRHISKGAWPFSTRDHGWPISDCTAEGLKASLVCSQLDFIQGLSPERFYDAVNVVLSMQQKCGGWATYELCRGPHWLEILNPSEVFSKIMVDYPHVECTSASVQALWKFRELFPRHRRAEIDRAIDHGIEFVKSIQRSDGSWYGFWAVCFCYGTWFGIKALSLKGGNYENSPHIRKACDFLVDKQMPDGGWGESYLSAATMQYVSSPRSQVVNTAWALLSLMCAKYPDHSVVERGIKLLMRRQMPNGDFPQENISGVFNANCMITYTNYRKDRKSVV